MAERAPVVAAVAALLVAVVMAFVLPASPRPEKPAPPVDGRDAFLEAWERSRLGTYVVDQRYTRTFPDGRSLTADLSIVQRPPDRLQIGAGEVEGRLGGEVVRCGVLPSGETSCVHGPLDTSYEEEVDAEVDRLREYVEGLRPLYRVTIDGDCFDLALALQFPTPPYGETARFCFDRETGAPTLATVNRPEATDVTEALRLVGEVTDGDLAIPDDIGRPLAGG